MKFSIKRSISLVVYGILPPANVILNKKKLLMNINVTKFFVKNLLSLEKKGTKYT